MKQVNLQRAGQSVTLCPPPSGSPAGRLAQIRAYQHLARVRLKEKLAGSPTGALLYDLLMRDQLAFIKLNAPARHA